MRVNFRRDSNYWSHQVQCIEEQQEQIFSSSQNHVFLKNRLRIIGLRGNQLDNYSNSSSPNCEKIIIPPRLFSRLCANKINERILRGISFVILPGTPRTFSSTCDCDDEDDNSEIHVSILTNPCNNPLVIVMRMITNLRLDL